MIARGLFQGDLEAFRETVRRFIAKEVAPFHASWEREGVVPKELWRKAGSAGLLCCDISDDYGGPGGSFLHNVVVAEEFSRAGCTGPAFSLHSDIVAPYLVNYGTEEQKRQWVPRLVDGTCPVAVAMTEPSGGSDLQSIKTVARRDGDEWVVTGQKVFITNAQNAGLIVLACKTDPSLGAKGMSLLLVETDRPGFRLGQPLEKVGCKAMDTSELFFDDVRVPAGNLLGVEGRGFAQLMTQLAQERLIQAVRATAATESILEQTADYVRQRKAFGKTLADFQNTRFELADMKAAAVRERIFVDRCLELHLDGALDGADAAMVKMTSTELLGRVVDRCLQLHGGWGYMWEFAIARAYADARQMRIAGGSIEIMKQIIARSLLGN